MSVCNVTRLWRGRVEERGTLLIYRGEVGDPATSSIEVLRSSKDRMENRANLENLIYCLFRAVHSISLTF
jgi:hypothetical protein